MRLVKVSVPQGSGPEIAELAFQAGMSGVCHSLETTWKSDGQVEVKDVVNARTSTPLAKKFLDLLLDTRWAENPDCTITVRQPQSIRGSESMRETHPAHGGPHT